MSDEAVNKPATAKRPALGRGLGALLGETRREEPLVTPASTTTRSDAKPSSGLAMLSVADIVPHPGQPRRHFAEEALAELAASIAQRGVIQPVIVTPHGQSRWRLVAGERRWRAAQRAHLHEIPAIVRDLDDTQTLEIALIENIQRQDLNPDRRAGLNPLPWRTQRLNAPTAPAPCCAT